MTNTALLYLSHGHGVAESILSIITITSKIFGVWLQKHQTFAVSLNSHFIPVFEL